MNRVDELAEAIWKYSQLNQKLEEADIIAVFGSYGNLQAEYGIQLFKEGWAPLILFSGGLNELGKSEAEDYNKIAIKAGILDSKIIVEGKATNTGENIIFTKEILRKKGIPIKKLIVVHKPYMERRTYATLRKRWPDIKAIITSPQISYEDYCEILPKEGISKELFINIIVSVLKKTKLYEERGFAIHQSIPKEIWASYLELVSLGYNKRLTE